MRRRWLALILTLAAQPALAIDCTRVKTEIEHAICMDAEAQAADRALGDAFDRLRSLLSNDERSGLRLSQIAWIRNRDATCLARRADTPLPKCLAEVSRERQRFLEGRPEAGDTEVSLFRPVFIFRPATKETAQLSIVAIKFTGVGGWQTKANVSVDKLVKDAIGDTDVRDKPPVESYSVDLRVSLSLATPHFVSVHAAYSNNLGQAHPFNYETNINIEIPTGRELTFDDSFDAAQTTELFQYCRSQVAKEKSERLGSGQADEVDLREVAEGTKDFSNWRFGTSGVDIYYGDYAFGGYGRCMCSCTVPYSRLHPVSKKDLLLP